MQSQHYWATFSFILDKFLGGFFRASQAANDCCHGHVWLYELERRIGPGDVVEVVVWEELNCFGPQLVWGLRGNASKQIGKLWV